MYTPRNRGAECREPSNLERFLFEDIAVNPDFNLAETDAERAFGVEHNTVGRYMTTAANTSTIGTLVNIPPAKRREVCAAFNAITTLATDAKSAQRIIHETIFLGHVLRNLPRLEAIMAKTGTLTGRDVIKNCFPEIRRPGNCDIATIRAWENEINTASLRNPQAAADILRRNADGLWPENAKLFVLPLLDNSTMRTTFTLDVAPDGNTATVTVTASPGLTEGFSPGDVFGHVQLTRQMTVDLRPDVPVVTDVKLAQKLVP